MRTAREIQDNISEVRDELDAIIAVAEREERDLTGDESKRVTEIVDVIVPELNTQLVTARVFIFFVTQLCSSLIRC